MAEDPTTGKLRAVDEVSGEFEALEVPTSERASGVTRHRVGSSIGPYSLRRVIGQGAMATVFEAEHTLIGRNVAIKVLHDEAAENPTAVARFFQEAQAINRLKHPHIVEITDVAEGGVEHAPFMVMELLEGMSLDRLIASRQALTPPRVADIGRQICDALQAVHSAGIVHRDLKPENVLVADGGSRSPRVKLLDFGVAKFLATEDNALRTRTGAIVGTPEYMAPEQVRGQPVDARTDIYALGCILFEMLTGVRPFQAPQLGELLRLQLQHKPTRPSVAAGEEVGGAISRHFDDLVLACLEKDPARRPSTMAEVADRLFYALDAKDTALIKVPKSLSDEYAKVVQAKAVTPWTRRWPPWAIAASALFAVVGGFGLWIGSGPGHPGEMTPESAPQMDATAGDDQGVSARRVTRRPDPKRPGAGGLTLASSPSRAAVYDAENGRFLGRTPLPLARPPRGRQLVVRAKGHQDHRFVLRPDAPEVVAIELTREAAPPRPMDTRPTRPEPMPPDPMPRDRVPGEWGTVDPFTPMARP